MYSCPLCECGELFQDKELYKNHLEICRENYHAKLQNSETKETDQNEREKEGTESKDEEEEKEEECKALVVKNSNNGISFKPTKIIEIGIVDNFYTKSSSFGSKQQTKNS